MEKMLYELLTKNGGTLQCQVHLEFGASLPPPIPGVVRSTEVPGVFSILTPVEAPKDGGPPAMGEIYFRGVNVAFFIVPIESRIITPPRGKFDI